MMKFSSEVRVAGIFQIDLASIKEPQAAGRTSVPTSTKDPADPSGIQTNQHRFKPVDAQLWQLNQFIQAEGQHQPNTVGVLHARKTKHRDANGKKTERIQLLIRPKVTGFFSAFIDGIKNGAEQKLAAEVVTTLRNAYENETRTPQASRPEYLNSPLKVNIKPAARVDTDALVPWLEEVANAIAENKLGKQGEPVLARQESMRAAVREALNPGSGVVAVGKGRALEQLKPYGFKPAQIKAFHKLVDDIVDGQASGGEDVYALETFSRQWLGLCDLTTDGGKKFRQFICDNPCYHTWNLVAHRLAGRTVPKFDLRSHSLCHYVMVPQVADMIWSEAASDNGAAHETVRNLHAKAAQDGTWQLKRTAYFEPTLFAAKSCVIAPEQTELDYEQKCYLDKIYRNIIAERVISGSRFLLTPLFNYLKTR